MDSQNYRHLPANYPPAPRSSVNSIAQNGQPDDVVPNSAMGASRRLGKVGPQNVLLEATDRNGMSWLPYEITSEPEGLPAKKTLAIAVPATISRDKTADKCVREAEVLAFLGKKTRDLVLRCQEDDFMRDPNDSSSSLASSLASLSEDEGNDSLERDSDLPMNLSRGTGSFVVWPGGKAFGGHEDTSKTMQSTRTLPDAHEWTDEDGYVAKLSSKLPNISMRCPIKSCKYAGMTFVDSRARNRHMEREHSRFLQKPDKVSSAWGLLPSAVNDALIPVPILPQIRPISPISSGQEPSDVGFPFNKAQDKADRNFKQQTTRSESGFPRFKTHKNIIHGRERVGAQDTRLSDLDNTTPLREPERNSEEVVTEDAVRDLEKYLSGISEINGGHPNDFYVHSIRVTESESGSVQSGRRSEPPSYQYRQQMNPELTRKSLGVGKPWDREDWNMEWGSVSIDAPSSESNLSTHRAPYLH
jgi:hypothetical protein